MEVWDFLQHCKTLYKPLLGCKAALQGMVLPSGLPTRGEEAGLGGEGYAPPLSQSVCPTLSLHIGQSCCGAMPMEVGMLLPGPPLMVGALLRRSPLLAGGEPRDLRGGYRQVLQALPDGVKDGFSLWLGRLTAQWSVEDEEEAARERRRREREKQLRSQAEEGLNGTGSGSESAGPAQENHYDFKPSGTSELEEDEGFSDWSQKLEQRKQRSPRQSYEEEDGGVREAEVKLEQIQLDQESPEEIREENVVTGEEERLCQEEEQVREQEEEEKAEQEEKKRRRNEEDDETPEKRQKAPSPTSLEEEELCSDHTAVCSTKVCVPGAPVVAMAAVAIEHLANGPSVFNLMLIYDLLEAPLKFSASILNSIKKTQPPLPVSKIDDRLEQYTQAIETSTKAPKPVRQPSLDLPTTSMMVASTKSLWETGEVAAQSAVKSLPCKDIVAGDIVSKRSLWEQKGNPKSETNIKSTPSGKKYKFVATGHGQYKKVLIDDAAEQ
ncbi:PREDICTED: lymphocyte-specific protein 1 [Pygoscelis adeliae]|uniref:lymphocyte-specific protein 1 n=1 Tax=Pygoscelis adeliae TaxID=9238 RepID=UPI0004F50383|nr:PREDICTED: lymphocyte-specific protein 1 [Pygoscelis adeliae]